MDSEPDQMTGAIKRALDAAEAANVAAEDIARISAAHRAFAEDVARRQKRSAALAAGAALGALLGLGLGGLIWFRSVADLREAGEVQATAAELLVEQVTRFDKMMDDAEARQAEIKAKLDEMTAQVSRDLAKLGREQQPMDAQIASAIRQGVGEDLAALKDEVLAAITKGGAAAGGLDEGQMKVLLEEMRAVIAPVAASAAAAAPKAEPAAAKPKPKPKAVAKPAKPAEPDPFVYP